jgi:hypothetical protein
MVSLMRVNFNISKQILGWNRTREYSVSDCRELQWHTQGEGVSYGLECEVGWRTIKFGEHISEDEAIDVLSALQSTYPTWRSACVQCLTQEEALHDSRLVTSASRNFRFPSPSIARPFAWQDHPYGVSSPGQS